MVESVWWKDGPIRRLPPRTREVCSEGWLVVGTEEAIATLSPVVSPVERRICVVRSYKDRVKTERTIKFEQHTDNWIF